TAASSLGNLNAGKWSDLVFNGNGIDFDGIKSQIRDLVGDEVGDEINSLWDALSGEFQGNGITFDFPFIKNPTGSAMQILLGQDGRGRGRVEAGVGSPDVVELTAGGALEATVAIGLSNPFGKDKIRPRAGDLGDRLFSLSGSVDAAANVRFKAGFDLLGEWIG